MLGSPITHDETLEIELILQQSVQQVTVLAAVRVVDLVVRAHDGGNTLLDVSYQSFYAKTNNYTKEEMERGGDLLLGLRLQMAKGIPRAWCGRQYWN